MSSAYQQLESIFQRIASIEGASAILGWDMQTVMPPGGGEARASHLAVLESLAHEAVTRPEVQDLLHAASADPKLDAWMLANLREMKRAHAHATHLDEAFVDRFARTRTHCTSVWTAARASGDFSEVFPALERVVDLTREAARRMAERTGLDPYDCLIDRFEPGMRAHQIDALFAPLAERLPGMIDAILDARASHEPWQRPAGPFPISTQTEVGRDFMTALGFDFRHGRLDVSAHPFCGGVPSDVRITTRYREDDFTGAFLGILHETGHALYENGLPGAWRHQPVGKARSMAVHESQSLFVEMQLCRSAAFFRWASPRLASAFGRVDDPAFSPENLTRQAQHVARTFIRVDADEVTYPLHVFLRFELEKALISGELTVAELPAAWDDSFERLFGLRPTGLAEGCMQDIHWMDGAFGYFPSYTMGAMLAAQLREAMTTDELQVDALVSEGAFAPVIAWLRERVHSRGSFLGTHELIVEATGRPLDADAFLRHVAARYPVA